MNNIKYFRTKDKRLYYKYNKEEKSIYHYDFKYKEWEWLYVIDDLQDFLNYFKPNGIEKITEEQLFIDLL